MNMLPMEQDTGFAAPDRLKGKLPL